MLSYRHDSQPCTLQYGKGGGGLAGYGTARVPSSNAVLYDPYAPAGQRYSCLAASPIPRYYHNSALLLPDGEVLVAGSEQGGCGLRSGVC